MRVLVTGATGLLGGTLVPILAKAGYEIITHGRTRKADVRADLSDEVEASKCLEGTQPNAIIHLVCLSNVDACEREPDLAYRLNVRALENVCAWVERNPERRLVHLSTDQVYDSPTPNRESDVVLRNYYGFSKFASELVALRAKGTVFRTNFFGRSHTEGKKSFSDWIRENLTNGSPVTLFTDVHFSPLSMSTLCSIVSQLLPSTRPGVFNLGSRNGMSKRDFAHRLAERLGLSVSAARDGLSLEANLPARRPLGMIMDSTKFEREFGLGLPTLDSEIFQGEV